MAIDSIPPWLDVNPGMIVSALEAGARTGAELNSANVRAQEHGQEMGFDREKLGATMQESAADRALREKLSTNAQKLSQQRFDAQMGLHNAQLGLRDSALQLMQAKQDNTEAQQRQTALQKAGIDSDASEFWKDHANGLDAKALAEKHPLALKRRDIQQFLGQQAQAEKSRKTITERVEALPSGKVQQTVLTGPPGSEMDRAVQALTKNQKAVPMPSDKSKLVTGTKYSTPKGEATWDGEKFVK